MAHRTEQGITFFQPRTISEAAAALEAGEWVEFDLDDDSFDDLDLNNPEASLLDLEAKELGWAPFD